MENSIIDITSLTFPELKTPPSPEIAYLDLDSLLFKSAQAAQKIEYYGIDKSGNEWGSFDSAVGYKNWIEQMKIFEADLEFGYTGDPEDLTRYSRITIGEEKTACVTFDKLLRKWVSRSGCKEWEGYVSNVSGAATFRHDIATMKQYKGVRHSNKPYYLEHVRNYAKTKSKVNVVKGQWEVDDIVCALAQRKGWRGCVVSVDKDSRGVNNTHIFIPDEMESPIFSSRKVLGELSQYKGKVVGYGTLFWLFQCLAGDAVDAISGCKGVGPRRAYELLRPFNGVSHDHLDIAVGVVVEAYRAAYGEEYKYVHHATGEPIIASWKDLLIEMSNLVYMMKGRNDSCIWLPHINEHEEKLNANDS